MFSDNYAITLDQKKQQMAVMKRGQGTVKMKAQIPEIGIEKRMQNREPSPYGSREQHIDDGSVSETSTMFRFNMASQQAKEAREAAKMGVPQEGDKFNTT